MSRYTRASAAGRAVVAYPAAVGPRERVPAVFEQLTPLPPDPILGLIAAYRDDPNPDKIDLGVGVYRDAAGTTPVLAAVREAERRLVSTEATKAYVSPPGDPAFLGGLAALLFSAEHPALVAERVGLVQTPGGCGALRLGGELVRRTRPAARVLVPDPTWGNHLPLLSEAGLELAEYPYYDRAAHAVDFAAMSAELKGLGPDDVVVLHGCCHNPCGADLTAEQWETVADLALERGFTPFVDIAYHGLAESLETDAQGVRTLAARVPELLVSYSCSKNFGLYRERTGMIAVVTRSPDAAPAATSHLNSIARGTYSMAPAHGASLVATILTDEELTDSWMGELADMRARLNEMRRLLVDTLAAKGAPEFGFIAEERGLFSFLGLSGDQVQRLVDDKSVYLVASSRINVAGITPDNVDYLAESILDVR